MNSEEATQAMRKKSSACESRSEVFPYQSFFITHFSSFQKIKRRKETNLFIF
jgi:hypothetical protein